MFMPVNMAFKKPLMRSPTPVLPAVFTLTHWLECVHITLENMELSCSVPLLDLPTCSTAFAHKTTVLIICQSADTAVALSLRGILFEYMLQKAVLFYMVRHRVALLCRPRRGLLQSSLCSQLRSLLFLRNRGISMSRRPLRCRRCSGCCRRPTGKIFYNSVVYEKSWFITACCVHSGLPLLLEPC